MLRFPYFSSEKMSLNEFRLFVNVGYIKSPESRIFQDFNKTVKNAWRRAGLNEMHTNDQSYGVKR